jgi:cytochrome c
MDSFELNKIFCAILATIFVTMSLSLASEAIFHAEAPETPGFIIEVAEADLEADVDTGPAYEDVKPLLASADAAAGQSVFKKCASCHSIAPGGANGVGPALYGVVGRDIAAVGDYGYSGALVEYGEGKQWNFDELNGFFWKPKTYIKGTAMGFAGIKDVQDRADLIAYLNENGDTPLDYPNPAALEAVEEAAEEVADEAAPAEEDAAATETSEEAPAEAEETTEDTTSN